MQPHVGTVAREGRVGTCTSLPRYGANNLFECWKESVNTPPTWQLGPLHTL
jgi:hypothetical protein